MSLSEKIVAALDFDQLHDSFPLEIQQTAFREGFARKTLLHRNLKKGEISKIKVRKKDVDFAVPGASGISTSQPRNQYIYPQEYTLSGLASIEDIDIAQDPELLGDAAVDVLENTMVKEDRLWKRMADQVAPVKPFNGFAEMKSALQGKNVPAGMWIMGVLAR